LIDKKADTRTISETIEMAKVHIYSENVHEKHTSAITNAYAFFLGIFVVLFSFLLENAIPLTGFAIGAVVLLAGTVYERYLVEKHFKNDLGKISEMIELIKAGKEVGSLEDLLRS
jgi:hypothetical protein